MQRRERFLSTIEGEEAKQMLLKMATDAGYSTDTSYSANSSLYPDNRMPFVDKHIDYLAMHPTIDPIQYISNLRLMTRVR